MSRLSLGEVFFGGDIPEFDNFPPCKRRAAGISVPV